MISDVITFGRPYLYAAAGMEVDPDVYSSMFRVWGLLVQGLPARMHAQ